jgi:hypothetical protein
MFKRFAAAGLAVALATGCSKDSTSVDPNGIDSAELSAVRAALNGSSFAQDTIYGAFYTDLSILVFPFIDRAEKFANGPGDTTRLLGLQLDINGTHNDTAVVTQLSGLLGWRGYSAATHTVDTVYFVLGTGLAAPISDSLGPRFAPDTAGTATAFVIHQATDSVVTTWLARQGAFHVTAVSYGGPRGLGQLTLYGGTMNGDYHVTARLVPDSSTSVSASKDFSGGIPSLKMRITGTF